MSFSFNFLEASDVKSSSEMDDDSTHASFPDRKSCFEVLRPEPGGIHAYFARVDGLSKSYERVCVSNIGSNDLVPGIYEGGLRLWECSVDLVGHLSSYLDRPNGIALEIGCGHGLPGICLLKRGFEAVVFSDFNEEVLRDVTWPNILRNVGIEALSRCFAGDWIKLCAEFEKRSFPGIPILFDVIVAAETLYTVRSCNEVSKIISRLLKPDGVAYIATKRFYFGVGGGTSEFISCSEHCSTVDKVSGRKYQLAVSIDAVYDDGSSNIREILKIVKKECF